MSVGNVPAVGSFTSFTCSAAFRFTPFRYSRSLLSFHQPQHCTAKAIPSHHFAILHTGFSCHAIPLPYTQNQHTVGLSHATTSQPVQLLHSVQSLHLPLPTAQHDIGMLYFFCVIITPPIAQKTVSTSSIESLLSLNSQSILTRNFI